jgi:hypothetical protein
VADKLFTTEALRHKGGKADELVDRSARPFRHPRAVGLMVCFLSTITASLAEAEKRGDVAATPKCGVNAMALRVEGVMG